MEEKILEIIEEIRPYINMEGGDIEFIKFEDDYVYVHLSGVCSCCHMQDTTLNNSIYECIKLKVPSLKGIINI